MDDQTKIQIAALVRRGRALLGEAKTISEEIKEIQSKLSDLMPIGYKDMIDNVECSRRSSNRTFDWKAYYESLAPEAKLECLRHGMALVDEKLVAKHAESAGKKEAFMAPPAEDKGVLKLMP